MHTDLIDSQDGYIPDHGDDSQRIWR